MNREQELAESFVQLADTLVDDYDVADLLTELVQRCVHLLDVSAAGLLLSDQRGGLQVLASSTERTHLLELFQVQTDEGPCLDCFTSQHPVLVPDVAEAAHRWPRFSEQARREGYRAVHAFPLRLREQTIGALNLFRVEPGEMPADDQKIARAMADVATIGILQERALRRSEVLTEQLQTALNSRVVIEQAKGMLAERGQIDVDEAFTVLRGHSRAQSVRLSAAARGLVEGRLDPALVLAWSRSTR